MCTLAASPVEHGSIRIHCCRTNARLFRQLLLPKSPVFAGLHGLIHTCVISFGCIAQRSSPLPCAHISPPPPSTPRLRLLATNRNMKRWCTKPGASAANRPVSRSTVSASTRACPAPRSVTASPVGTPLPTPRAYSIAPWPTSRQNRYIRR